MTHREVPGNAKMMTPIQAVYQILRDQHALMGEERSEFEAARKKSEKAICEIALALFNFQRNRAEWTDSTRRAYQTVENALKKSGVEIVDYTGYPLDDDLLETVKVEGWEASDNEVDTVKETFMPEIRWNGTLLHQAQVFGLSAADEGPAAMGVVNGGAAEKITGEMEETVSEAVGNGSCADEQCALESDSIEDETKSEASRDSILRRVYIKIKLLVRRITRWRTK